MAMSTPSGPLRLPRARRVTRGRDFLRAKAEGRRLAVGCLALNWLDVSNGSSRLGVITSKRIGGAVVRTRARRLLREAFRRHQYRIARAVDVVLVARQSIVGLTFSGVESDFLTALKRADLLRAE